jgi:GT2 family glycosyltransferase
MADPAGMSGHPAISVCIANYNGMAVIDDCLQSIRQQSGLTEAVEIIVHDDASTDGSPAYIRARYPDVSLIESTSNVGFCTANNRMVAQARGRYVLLLNNDAALFPDALSNLLAHADTCAKPTLLSLSQHDWESGRLLDTGYLLDPFLNPIPNLDLARRDVAMVVGACLWLPRSLWQELGGFPDWFGSIAEDLYLCLMARLAGYPVQALGESGFRHRVGHSFGGGKVLASNRLATTTKRRALSERNKTFVMVMTYPAPWFQILFPVHLALLLLEGLILAAAKKQWTLFEDIYLACIRAVWSQRALLAALRRQIQSRRKIETLAFMRVFSPFPHKVRLLLRHGWPTLS